MTFHICGVSDRFDLDDKIKAYRQATKHLGPCRVSAGKQNGQWVADLIVEVRK